jgi:dTMP kinase
MGGVSRAMLIVLEGLDGSGKSTLASALAAQLDATLLRTPDDSLAEVRPRIEAALLHSPRAQTLFYASTVLAASERARRELAQGRVVVMDRYWFSTMAYAELEGRELALDPVASQLLPADLTVLLDVPREIRATRMAGRGALSPHDRRSLDPAGERRLLDAYQVQLATPLAGRALHLEAGTQGIDALVHRLLMELPS